MKKCILILLIVIKSVNYVQATTYYISTTGSDNNTGMSEFQAWANFKQGISSLEAGDELIILNGIYYQSIHISKSGTTNSPIVIRAQNDGKVIIDGQNVRRPITISGNYIIVVGIIFQHSNSDIVSITGDYNIFKRCSAYYSQNKHCWAIDEAQHNLIEDCVAAATERHLFKSYSSSGLETHTTFRRCFGVGTIPNVPSTQCESEFNCYAGSFDIFENCIGWGGTRYASISIHSQNTHFRRCRNNKVLGSIFMRGRIGLSIGRGLNGSQENPKDNYFENCIIYGNSYGVRLEDNCDNTIFNHCTIINNSIFGMSSESFSNIIKNVIIYNNSAGYTKTEGSFSYINIYQNQSNNSILDSWMNCISKDPFIDGTGLVIPNNSPCKWSGEDSTDIGANIYNKYENGVLTNKSLWPWPMQDRIKKELGIDVMAELESIFGPIVEDNSLKASINVSHLSGPVPLSVNLIGSASGGISPYSYYWDFGDGSTSNQQNPSHTYTKAGDYTAVLSVTDNNGNHATSSVTIHVIDPSDVLSIKDIKFTSPGEDQAVSQLEREVWYDLYLYFNTPNGWSEIAFADVWINSPSYTEGTIDNRGGVFHAASSYVMSFTILAGYEGIWSRQEKGSSRGTYVTGTLGLYVDDRNNEYQINSTEGWAKVRMKLLTEAEIGDWSVNAYVKSRDGIKSILYKKHIVLENTTSVELDSFKTSVKNKTLQMNLQQNYPNPFNLSTEICYTVPYVPDVHLDIFNTLGQHIVTLAQGKQSSGQKTVIWDGRDKRGMEIPSGLYFYRLKAGDFFIIKKMFILR